MYSLRRVLSLLLIAAMLFSLSCEAFAATITLPAALKEIDEEAFYGDESLDEVVLPYGATTIGPLAFACSGLKQIIIPDTVTEIAADAFERTADVTILSSTDSYAKLYAERYGLSWEDDGNYYASELDGAFKGKTIAFMGDSLIGNFNDHTGICAILAELTGATVINCAFGGTRMAYSYSVYGDATPGATGYRDGATDSQINQVNQYRLWNTLSGYALAQAIATGSWIAQENAVANLSLGLSYFSSRLADLKAVDWTKVDYLMWDYGTNDFTSRVKVSDSENTSNYFAFDNAYRKAIETILTAYPNIKIIPITPMYRWWNSAGAFVDDSNTHTENDYTGVSRLLTAFAETAQAVAKESQLPCIDIYNNLGVNRSNYLDFFNSTDGVHPNANGRNQYAHYVYSQLNALETS